MTAHFPSSFRHPPALSTCEATSSEELLARRVCSPSPKGTLLCLSPCSHDPVSLRHFSTPGFFLFVSSLTIPLPPLWHRHLIFTFRLGGTEEAFPCVPPLCSTLVFGNKCDIQGSQGGQSLPGGNHTTGGHIGYPWTQGIRELLTVSFLGRAFSASVSLRLGFVPRGACCASIVAQLWEPAAWLSTGAAGQCRKAPVLLTYPMGGSSCSPEGLISNEEIVSTSASRRFLFCTQMSSKEQVWMEAPCLWQASLSLCMEMERVRYTHIHVQPGNGW